MIEDDTNLLNAAASYEIFSAKRTPTTHEYITYLRNGFGGFNWTTTSCTCRGSALHDTSMT